MSNDNPFNVNKELLDYVKSAKEHGLPDSEIKQNLLNAGWEPEDIENTFAHFVASIHMQKAAAETQSSLLSPLMQEKPGSVSPSASPTQNFAEQTALNTVSKKSHWGLWLFLFIFILLLAGGAFYVYTYGYFTPTQIWNKFANTEESKIYKNKFSFSYNDNYTPSDEKAGKKIEFKNIKGSFDGSFYVNVADSKNPESSSEVQYTFGSGNTNISTGFQYRLKNNTLYINAGSNPFLDLFTQSLSDQSGKKPEWLKLDLNALQNTSGQKSEASTEDLEKFKAVFNDEFKNKLEKIWSDAKLVKVKKVLGHEKLNGLMTLHFQNELDKQALTALINSYIDNVLPTLAKANEQDAPKQEDLDLAHKMVSGIINKITISDFETWIGVKDFRLYKVKLVSNAPSLLSAINASERVSSSSNDLVQRMPDDINDRTRVGDMISIRTVLELYKNKHGGFPEAKDGEPLGLSPDYIKSIPKSPKPPGTNCSEYYNTYWYTPTGTKKTINSEIVYSDYTYGFCLGGDVHRPDLRPELQLLKAGIGKMTQENIQSGLPCDDTEEHCKANNHANSAPDQNAQMQKEWNEFLSKLDFNAQINLQAEYSDFGKIRAIDEPKEFYDLTQMIVSSQTQTRDEKRLSDIRHIANALGLYFMDKSAYPKDLKDLHASYWDSGPSEGPFNRSLTMPVAPTPADGSCTESENSYTYKQISTGNYQLSFCLGAPTGGYSAGKHILSPAGIQ